MSQLSALNSEIVVVGKGHRGKTFAAVKNLLKLSSGAAELISQ